MYDETKGMNTGMQREQTQGKFHFAGRTEWIIFPSKKGLTVKSASVKNSNEKRESMRAILMKSNHPLIEDEYPEEKKAVGCRVLYEIIILVEQEPIDW